MILEFRTYRLLPGTREEFVRVMRQDCLPLLAGHGIDVVGCGPSLVDEDGHEEAFLIRAFGSLDEHRRQEASFYGSDAWQRGPRAAILSKIESYHTIVIETSAAAIDALRATLR